MRVTVEIVSSEHVETAAAKVWGITPGSYSYANDAKAVDLERGLNVVNFDVKTPNCISGCGGVKPGAYKIFASVELMGEEKGFAETGISLVEEVAE